MLPLAAQRGAARGARARGARAPRGQAAARAHHRARHEAEGRAAAEH